jgi:uncharacterized protein with ParB-like and HNH nuclease domain
MAKNKFMEELSVEELIEGLNFFVPEIQREYVWGYNEREILDVFLTDLIEGKQSESAITDLSAKISELSKLGKFEEIKQLVESKGNVKPMNIGFLYSYEPNYRMEHFPESDYNKDVYLIDGQQRLTTLFILLFYLSIKEERKEEFCDMFRFNSSLESVAFDYRVRNLTHNFFINMINNINSLDEVTSVKNSTWFLIEYSKDPTVFAVVKALEKINEYFENKEDSYFDFLKTQVKFWHFKTEKTDQGEELYITMNSRGKQLEDNETIRAKLFENIPREDELEWSEEWEKWQDFFWQHRDRDRLNSSSDHGFNEFLICIAGFESLLSKSDDFIALNDPIYASRILNFITLEKIKKYFKSFTFLIENYESFKNGYEYAEWLPECISFTKDLIFRNNTNWFVNYDDDLRARERRHMVFMWSVFHFLNSFEFLNNKVNEIYRLLRIYWLRYNNHDRSVKSLIERCNYFVENGIWSHSISDDEESKHSFLLQQHDDYELRKFESALWKLEDHPLNINGYQVQNQNITHLIDFSDDLSLDTIISTTSRFQALFGKDKTSGSKKLSTTLLYFGFNAMQRTPYYYDNWDFNSWRRIIRDLDSKDTLVFKTFFNLFQGGNLKEILAHKKEEFILENMDNIEKANSKIECDSLIDCVRYYALVAPDLWKKGRNIAESEYLPNESMTTYESRALFNTKGNFRGYGHTEFYELLEKPIDEAILDIKKMLKDLE